MDATADQRLTAIQQILLAIGNYFGQHHERLHEAELVRVYNEAMALEEFSAECHSEDRVVEVSFDARLWLSEASDDEIRRADP